MTQRKLRLGAFIMATGHHIAAWRHPGAQADAGINIELIATSEIRTSCVVAEADGVRALQAVHAAFGLGGSVVHKAEGSEAPI